MASLSDLFQQIDSLKVQLDAMRPLSVEQFGRLRTKMNLEWNYHSNAIEGNTLTLGETRAFLFHGITARGKPFKDYLDIKGHKAAIEHIEEIVRAQHPLTEADIRYLHEILLVEAYDMPAMTAGGQPTKRRIRLGEYKSVPNHVETATGELHTYASPEETPAMMGDLMHWYRVQLEKAESHPVVIATLFHYRFVAIHPFDDGNGRMARLLMNLVLMQLGYAPAVIKIEQRAAYLLTLSQADAGETEPFVTFIAELVMESLTLALKAARGESLAEPDDLDKRLGLLQQQILEPEKLQEPRTVESMAYLTTVFLEPFLEHLAIQITKFNPFFEKNHSSTCYKYENDTENQSHLTTIKSQFAEIITTAKGNENLCEVEIVLKWLQFINTRESLGLFITFDFQRYEFICTFRLRKNIHRYIPKGLVESNVLQAKYNTEFTDDEIFAKVNIILDAVYQYIEELVSKYKIKNQ